MDLASRDDLLEYRDRERRAFSIVSTDDLGGVLDREAPISRINPFRGEGEVEIDAGLKPRLLKDRPENLISRARERRALEDHEVTRSQMRRDAFGGGEDVAQVRLLRAIEWRRHGNEDQVHVAQQPVVRAGIESTGLELGAKRLAGDVLDVAVAPAQPGDA